MVKVEHFANKIFADYRLLPVLWVGPIHACARSPAGVLSLEGAEMSSCENNATYAVQTVVRGYHVYKEVWSATVGQVLPCQQERGNVHDSYSVATVDGNTVVGHVPRVISAHCSLFLRRNGVVICEVTLRTCGIPPARTLSRSPSTKIRG